VEFGNFFFPPSLLGYEFGLSKLVVDCSPIALLGFASNLLLDIQLKETVSQA